MKEIYLELTFRHGRLLAAYLYLPREGNEKTAGGQPIGLEITAPGRVSTATINRVLADLGLSPLSDADLAPLRAA
jgi:hypothetical protein